MDAPWQAVLDLLRLGLKGDGESVRQFGLRLLRRPPALGGDDAAFREALSRLLVAEAPPAGAARSVRGAPVGAARGAPRAPTSFAPPVDHETFAALARVEVLPHAPLPVLPPEVADQLDRVVGERRQLDRLTRLGLDPTRTVLLTGAPGVGKTMAARYLAGALGLPLVTLDLATVVSSYLGKTGQNLRLALDAARAEPCVLLLDEFDALAKRRDDPADVGELKRIVNVLLLEIERWPAGSLLVAATNHPELLDRAIWRRFDVVLALPLPDAAGRAAILRRLLDEYRQPLPEAQLHALTALTHSASGSELARLVRTAARRAALAVDRAGVAGEFGQAWGDPANATGAPDASAGDTRAGEREPANLVGPGAMGVDVFWPVLQELVLGRLRDVARTDRAARVAYVGAAYHAARRSLRAIAADLGVTHPTASQALREYDAQQPASGRPAAAEEDAGATGSPVRDKRRGRGTRAELTATPRAAPGVATDGDTAEGRTGTRNTASVAPNGAKSGTRPSRRAPGARPPSAHEDPG